MEDIIIIGAGTAGLTAAIYGARANKSVLVIEEINVGGQIAKASEIENYPGIINVTGKKFADELYRQAVEAGAHVIFESVMSIENHKHVKFIKTDENVYESKSVIIATGSKNKTLGIEGERKLVGHGISYCATCDGAFFKGLDVAVAGGGNTALKDALLLSETCRQVYLIHRRKEFRGEERLVEEVGRKTNINLILESKIISLNEGEKLEEIEIINKDQVTEKLKVSGLFVAIGQAPDNERFKNVVKVDENGYIIATEDCTTETPGIFVAGDCRKKEIRQLSTAAADGAVAGIKASEYHT